MAEKRQRLMDDDLSAISGGVGADTSKSGWYQGIEYRMGNKVSPSSIKAGTLYFMSAADLKDCLVMAESGCKIRKGLLGIGSIDVVDLRVVENDYRIEERSDCLYEAIRVS